MKNKIGSIAGFLAGSIGFLALFKIFFLDHTPPEDELAPGMVVIIAIVVGVASAFAGSWIQKFFKREKGI